MSQKCKSLILIFLLVFCFTACTKIETSINSPDGKLALSFMLEDDQPLYALSKDGKEVIQASSLGFDFSNMPGMKDGFMIDGSVKSSHFEEWEQTWGECRYITDSHNKLLIKLREKSKPYRIMHVVFKLFDDGLGFRYIFPEQPGLDSIIISDEYTRFTFPEEHNVWWIPVHADNSYYESLYRYSPISQTDTINTPATFKTRDGYYLTIHEANLTDYASMTLRMENERQYVSELVPWSNGVKVYGKPPFETPWRTIIVADEPGELITSTLMLNLNEPLAIEDVSWIEPSKYIGIWWGMHLNKYTWAQGPNHGATTENAKKYIKFAAKYGFNAVLIEGWNYGWDGNWFEDGSNFSFTNPYPDFNLEEVALFAAANNVRIVGHHETGGAVRNYEEQMEDAFKLYQKNGINSVKTGYVNKYLDNTEWHDGQYGVRHYRKVIETAAKYRIMIDNHEPVKGTGLQRTYPNLVTQEGARGMEYNAWSDDGGNPPDYTTILPFTRMLSGPFDFTPGIVNYNYEVYPGTRPQSTIARQLAHYVIIFSPHQMVADLPENYKGHPALDFIVKVPCIWSDTKVMNASIGEFVTIARQDWYSDEWYLGSITNEESRNFNIPLSFLENDRIYQAEIYSDTEQANWESNPYPMKIEIKKVTRIDELNLYLAPGGGSAVRFVPLGVE